MIPLVDRGRSAPIAPIWRMPFRPLFWGAALWSVVALMIWQAQLAGVHFPALRGGVVWHSHEMLFGFAATVVVGFLGTAMQTWTGIPSPKGRALMLLVALWVLSRVGYLFGAVPLWIPVASEGAFFLTAAILLGGRVIRARQWNQLFVLPALIALTALATVHWLVPGWQSRAALLTLLLITGIILIIGGRVIPFFTARRFQRQPRRKLAILEYGTYGTVVALLLAVATDLPRMVWALLALTLGVLQLVRVLRWHPTVIWREPLVWSLHISYWLVVLGFFLAALAWSGLVPQWHSPALHAFAVGGIGGLILAMVSRVSLGHTGRRLAAPGLMPWAFAALAVSALARVFLAPAPAGYALAAVAWVVGFGMFLFYYSPVLFSARADGHPE